jgi:DinB superfamily
MAIKEGLLPEFDQEMANTRKTLERVPDDKLAWKPHEKSGTLGWLAGHVATLPGLAKIAITQGELDMAQPSHGLAPPSNKTRTELLEVFDKSVAEARAAISETSDAEFMKPWTLLKNGQKLLTVPKATVMRSFVMNHFDSSPGTTRRLSATEQYSRPVDLRPIG